MPLLSLLHRLLPFATPGTPLLQDLAHTAALCLLLYCGPQIQHFVQARGTARQTGLRPQGGGEAEGEIPPADGDRFAEVDEFLQGDEDRFEAGNRDDDDDDDDDVDDDDNDDDDAFVRPAAADPAALGDGDENDGAQPGPANPRAAGPNAPAPPAATRNVGAKKAKSLARRDQRRAYNEFLRSQGDAQRAADAAGQREREAVEAAERERRRAAEAVLEARKAREREERREREREGRAREVARRERVVALVRARVETEGRCDLFDVARGLAARGEGDVDEEWVEGIVKASGVLGAGAGDGAVTVLTSMGWVVRVTGQDMAALYEQVVRDEAVGDAQGRIEYEEMGRRLETVLRTEQALKG